MALTFDHSWPSLKKINQITSGLFSTSFCWSRHVLELSIVNLNFGISDELNTVSIGRKGGVRWQHAWPIMTRTQSHRAERSSRLSAWEQWLIIYRQDWGRNTANFLDPDEITPHAHTHTHQWSAKVRGLECICVLFDFPVASIQVYFVSRSYKMVLTLLAHGLDVYF